jgi:hypothetical protein
MRSEYFGNSVDTRFAIKLAGERHSLCLAGLLRQKLHGSGFTNIRDNGIEHLPFVVVIYIWIRNESS